MKTHDSQNKSNDPADVEFACFPCNHVSFYRMLQFIPTPWNRRVSGSPGQCKLPPVCVCIIKKGGGGTWWGQARIAHRRKENCWWMELFRESTWTRWVKWSLYLSEGNVDVRKTAKCYLVDQWGVGNARMQLIIKSVLAAGVWMH